LRDDPQFWLWLSFLLLFLAGSSFFVWAWIGTSLLLSWFSGWRQLACRYRASQPPTGERFRMPSLAMRWGTAYHGSAYLSADSDGLFLSAISLLRAGHPPLFIPWSDITFSRERRWRADGVSLRFAQAPDISLHIHTESATKAFANGPLRLDA